MTDIQAIEITPDTPREVRVLHDWADVDRALFALRIVDAELSAGAAGFDGQISDLMDRKQQALQPLVNRRDRMNDMLREWVGIRRDDFAPDQSIKLVHGTVGYRKGAVSITTEDEARSIELLEKRGHNDCIETKRSLVKAAVKKLNAADLFVCGFKLDQSEAFYIKLAKSPAITYPVTADTGAEVEDV